MNRKKTRRRTFPMDLVCVNGACQCVLCRCRCLHLFLCMASNYVTTHQFIEFETDFLDRLTRNTITTVDRRPYIGLHQPNASLSSYPFRCSFFFGSLRSICWPAFRCGHGRASGARVERMEDEWLCSSRATQTNPFGFVNADAGEEKCVFKRFKSRLGPFAFRNIIELNEYSSR